MANKKINDLTQDTNITGNEVFPVYDIDGVTKKVSINQINTFISSTGQKLVYADTQPNGLEEGDMWLSTSSSRLFTKVQNQFIELV